MDQSIPYNKRFEVGVELVHAVLERRNTTELIKRKGPNLEGLLGACDWIPEVCADVLQDALDAAVSEGSDGASNDTLHQAVREMDTDYAHAGQLFQYVLEAASTPGEDPEVFAPRVVETVADAVLETPMHRWLDRFHHGWESEGIRPYAEAVVAVLAHDICWHTTGDLWQAIRPDPDDVDTIIVEWIGDEPSASQEATDTQH